MAAGDSERVPLDGRSRRIEPDCSIDQLLCVNIPDNRKRSVAFNVLLTLTSPELRRSDEYRLRENRLEFLKGDGTWRILGSEEVRFHWLLRTEVVIWLLTQSPNQP